MKNVKSFGATDIGQRLNNEDVWAQFPKEHAYILADGMGGHLAGEIAASQAVLSIGQSIKEADAATPTPKEWVSILEKAFKDANTHIQKLSAQNAEMQGMGTTVCVALIKDDSFIYAHIGDSRIYRLRKGRLTQLTRDHSLRDELIASGELDESLALSFPYKNVITRALGSQKNATPDIAIDAIEPKDLYFLCSDGLSDALTDAQIRDIIEDSPSLPEAVNSLIVEAKKNDASDNITIVMIKIS